MTREEIQAEFDAFFEFPGKGRDYVTSVSCRLFAERIAEMERTKHIDEIQRLTTLANTAEKWRGMTLRDYFAVKAMPAVYSEYCSSAENVGFDEGWMMGVAMDAYAMADAMLAAREKGNEE